jgi:hypothetical protein
MVEVLESMRRGGGLAAERMCGESVDGGVG